MSSPLFQHRDKDFYNLCFQVFLTSNAFWVGKGAKRNIDKNPENQLVRKYLRHLCFEVEVEPPWYGYCLGIMPGLCAGLKTITLNMGDLIFRPQNVPFTSIYSSGIHF